jgi:hypothetical protein
MYLLSSGGRRVTTTTQRASYWFDGGTFIVSDSKPHIGSSWVSKAVMGLLLLGTTFVSGDDYSWDTRFGAPAGVRSIFRYMEARQDGPLYAADANRVVTLDGIEWLGLGDRFSGSGIGRGIVALDIDTNHNPVVGGNFEESPNVMRWDGDTWKPIGPSIGRINDFALDSEDHVWAGGGERSSSGISGTHLLELENSQWVQRGPLHLVSEIAADDNGNVYALGMLNATSDEFGAWNGTAWTELPHPGPVEDLVVAGGRLYAWDRENVLVFDDSVWSVMGADPTSGVTDLKADFEGNIFITRSSGYVQRWDGSAWVHHGSKFNGGVYVISGTIDGGLYVSGRFTSVGDHFVRNTARWVADDWYAYEEGGLGLDSQVRTLVARKDGSIVASGSFNHAGDLAVANVATWDGFGWHQMDSIYATQFATDSQGTLYAVGVSRGARGLFRWTNEEWQLLARTIGYGWPDGYGSVYALAIDASDHIYVGGAFDEIDGVRAKRIAMWDGEAWRPLGSGINGTPANDTVWELVLGGDGDLYVGGTFTGAGGVESENVIRWDGEMWHPLNTGVQRDKYSPRVSSIAWTDSSLYVGGEFERAGSVAVRNIGRWDGVSWHPLEEGVNGGVLAMHSYGKSLFVGGQFVWATDVLANGLVRWDGLTWDPVEPTLNGEIWDITVGVDSVLYVGGRFSMAGDVSSLNFASAPIPVERPDPTEPGIVVYPNPASARVTIGVSVQVTAQVRGSIFDALGRLVHVFYEGELEANQAHTFDVDVRSFSSGSYFVQVVSGKDTLTAKFVVVH